MSRNWFDNVFGKYNTTDYQHLTEEQSDALRPNRLSGNYYKGIKGLTARDREWWDKSIANSFGNTKLSDADQDYLFKNTAFSKIIDKLASEDTNKEDKYIQEIYNNKSKYLNDESLRDITFANLAENYDLDLLSDRATSSRLYETLSWVGLGDMERMYDPYTETEYSVGAGEDYNIRSEARKFRNGKINQGKFKYKRLLQQLGPSDLQEQLDYLDKISDEASPYYQWYKGTDEINSDLNSKIDKLSTIFASQELGFNSGNVLNDLYQDEVANNQSKLELTVASLGTFATDVYVTGVGAAGLGYGLLKWIGSGFDDAHDIIDNAITQYASDVMTTGIWFDSEERKRAKELGMNQFAMHKTVDQMDDFITSITGAELFGQYGFTVGSMLLSGGTSAAVRALASGTQKLIAAAGTVGRLSAKTASNLIKITKGLEKVGYAVTPGLVGTVEGTIEAQASKDEFLRNAEADIHNYYQDLYTKDLQTRGYSDQEIADMLNKDREAYLKAYNQQIQDELKIAEEGAETAMTSNFVWNSIINGVTNTLLKKGFQSARVQDSLDKLGKKLGLSKKGIYSDRVNITRAENNWSASPKQVSVWKYTKRRIRDSFGEGAEEYAQNLSNAYSQAYSNAYYKDDINRYRVGGAGNNTMLDTQADFFSAAWQGLTAAGEAAISKDAFREALYGMLSTIQGGPGIVTRVDPKTGNLKTTVGWNTALDGLLSKVPLIGKVTPYLTGNQFQAEQLRNEEIAKQVNKFLQDESVQKILNSQQSLAQVMLEVQEAIEKGDIKTAKDGTIAKYFYMIQMLDQLKGTEYYDTVMKHYEAIKNFREENLEDATSAESLMVKEFLNQPLEVNSSTKSPNERKKEILQMLKDRANDFTETIKKKESLEALYGQNLPSEVVSSMVYRNLLNENRKKRIEEIRGELKKLRETERTLNNRATSQSLSQEEIRATALYGSVEEAIKQLEEQEKDYRAAMDQVNKEVETLKTEVKNASKDQKKDAKDKLNNAKRIKRRLESFIYKEKTRSIDLKKLKDIAASREEESKPAVLTAEQLLSLSEEDLAIIFRQSKSSITEQYEDNAGNKYKKTRQIYSKEQKQEINKVLRLGRQQMRGFEQQLNDAATLQRDIESNDEVMFDLLSDDDFRLQYIQEAYSNMRSALFKSRHSHLVETIQRDDFDPQELNQLIDESDNQDLYSLDEMFKSDKKAYEKYRRLYQRKSDIRKIRNMIRNKKEFEFQNESDETKAQFEKDFDIFDQVLGNIQNFDIDVLNAQEVIDYLKANKSTNDILEEIREKTNLSDEELYKIYSDYINYFNDIVKENLEAHKPIDNDSSGIDEVQEKDEQKQKEQQAEQKKKAFKDFLSETPDQESVQSIIDELKSSGYTVNIDSLNEKLKELVQKVLGNNNISGIAKEAFIVILNKYQNGPILSEGTQIDEIYKDSFIDLLTRVTEQLSTTEDKVVVIEDLIDTINTIKRSIVLEEQGNETIGTVIDLFNSQINPELSKISNIVDSAMDKVFKDLAQRNFVDNQNTVQDGNIFQSMPLSYMLNTHPNSPTSAYIRSHNILQALQNGVLYETKGKEVKKKPIYFVVDPKLTSDTRAAFNQYQETNDLPVIAVVQSDEGTLTIDGVKYQPIAIMASSGNVNVSGTRHLQRLRNLAIEQGLHQQNDNKVSFIMNQGKKLSTKIANNGLNIQFPFDQSQKGKSNTISSVIENDSKRTKDSESYKSRFIKFIVENLKIGDEKRQGEYIYFELTASKNSTPKIIRVKDTDISETKNSEGRTIKEILLDDKLSDEEKRQQISEFNVLTKAIQQSLVEYSLPNMASTPVSITQDSSGLVLTEDSKKDLLNLLKNSLSKGVFLRNGYSYDVVVRQDGNNYFLDFSIKSYQGVLPLVSIPINDKGELQINLSNQVQIAQSIVYSLFGAELLTSNSKLKWQIDHDLINSLNIPEHKGRASHTLYSLIQQGIMSIDASNISFIPEINRLSIEAPKLFKDMAKAEYEQGEVKEDELVEPNPKEEKSEEKSEKKPEEKSKKKSEEKSKGLTQEQEDALKMLQEKAKQYHIPKDDDRFYVRAAEGRETRLPRITSLIQAAIGDEGSEIPEIWKLPSTTVGNEIDRFYRDCIEAIQQGKKEDFLNKIDTGEYKNAKQNSYFGLLSGIEEMIDGFKEKGLELTFIPKDLTVEGDIEVMDNGVKRTIRAAGTLDLLAYDQNGNFYIFDMKTKRGKVTASDIAKWKKQTELYASFIEKATNGVIKISSINIIPISVDYPHPNDVNYSVDQSDERILLADGKPVDAKPNFSKQARLDLFVERTETRTFGDKQVKYLSMEDAKYDVNTKTICLNDHREASDKPILDKSKMKDYEQALVVDLSLVEGTEEQGKGEDSKAQQTQVNPNNIKPVENPIDFITEDEGFGSSEGTNTNDVLAEQSKESLEKLEELHPGITEYIMAKEGISKEEASQIWELLPGDARREYLVCHSNK